MLSAYFPHHELASIEFLPQEERYNSRFFPETVLPRIEKSLSVAHPRMRAKIVHLHIDDTKCYNSEMSLSFGTPVKTLAAVMNDWIRRLTKGLEFDGDYIH
jgi:hypothetical protein